MTRAVYIGTLMCCLFTLSANKILGQSARGNCDEAGKRFERGLDSMRIYFNSGSFSSAMVLGERLLDETNDCIPEGTLAQVMTELSRAYQFVGYSDRQYELAVMVGKIGNSMNDSSLIVASLSSIGDVYKKGGDWDNALAHYYKALKISKAAHVLDGEAQAYNNIGTYYLLTKKQDSSVFYLDKALKLYQRLGNEERTASVLIRLGRAYLRKSNWKRAKAAFEEALVLSKQIGAKPWIGRSYCFLGRTEHWKNRKVRAMNYYDSAVVYLKPIGDYQILKNVYLWKSELFASTNQFNSALIYYKMGKQLSDTVTNRLNIENIRALGYEHQLSVKEQEIIVLEEKKSILKEKQKAEVKAKLWLYVALGVILIIAFLLYYLLNQRSSSLLREKKMRELEGEKYLMDLELKNKELTTVTMQMLHKSEDVAEIHAQLKDLENKIAGTGNDKNKIIRELQKISKGLVNTVGQEKEWEQFKLHFEKVHKDFFVRLKSNHPELTSYDLKLCAYFYMNIGINQVANIMNVSYDAVKKQRTRMRKKMSLPKEVDLLHHITTLAAN